jgi:hypothetical protein
MFKPLPPMPEFKELAYPGPDATEVELDAFFDERDKQIEEYAKWEKENKWQIIGWTVFVFSLIPIGAIFWGWDIVKERFQRGRRA